MRNSAVSISKAIGIILMVLAHTRFSRNAEMCIALFHMPLFFFFAGYCFKDKYTKDIIAFIKKRLMSIYWPYVKWSLIFLAFHNLFYHLNIYNDIYGWHGKVSHLYTMTEYAQHAKSIILRMSGHEQLLGGYWFMKSLFVASILGAFTIRFIKKPLIGGAFF